MYNCSGQVYFLIDMLNKMAPDHPEWQKQQPFASLLKKGPEALKDVGLSGAFDALAGIYSNQPISDIQVNAQQFLKKEHPAHKIPFSETTYLPMVELISYLQKNQFKVFIVSGGTLGFMRAFTNDIYNVPNEQVIGKRPIIAVGNSDGDIEILTYATEADGIQLGLLVNHDDELREGLGGHVERAHSLARSNSEWIIISIKTDFKKVFTDKTN
ncbi:hypothetical protein MNBD_GAMMA09-2804 [hydrothermal vent metagenome]|uniref:Uncharacterized protein n=1 Tax=hydrothermal vent metagenome TaxID=652676 RepID=A0A3B0XTR2_9ZZZZ